MGQLGLPVNYETALPLPAALHSHPRLHQRTSTSLRLRPPPRQIIPRHHPRPPFQTIHPTILLRGDRQTPRTRRIFQLCPSAMQTRTRLRIRTAPVLVRPASERTLL
jgi:hypothetical protein